jgi:hypothetical protein
MQNAIYVVFEMAQKAAAVLLGKEPAGTGF